MSETQTVEMHAHRCENCAGHGKQTIWIHTENERGQIAAHKCPECGEIQWKKFLVQPGRLPQTVNAESGKIQWEMLLGYLVVLVGVAILGYAAYQYIRERKALKVAPL